MDSNKEIVYSKHCTDVVQDIHSIISQINRYLHMKGTSSIVDIFFYIERSVRAKALCQQIASSADSNCHHQEELDGLYQVVKSRWQQDFQLIATPAELHQYLKDDGTTSLHKRNVIL